MKLPAKDAKLPGLSIGDMTKDQKELIEKVMKELVSPYRKEDGDEVMEIIKANGGMEKISLAFYQEGEDDRRRSRGRTGGWKARASCGASAPCRTSTRS